MEGGVGCQQLCGNSQLWYGSWESHAAVAGSFSEMEARKPQENEPPCATCLPLPHPFFTVSHIPAPPGLSGSAWLIHHPPKPHHLQPLSYPRLLLPSTPLLSYPQPVPETNGAYSAGAAGVQWRRWGRAIVGLQTHVRPKWRRPGFSGVAGSGVGLWEPLREWWTVSICHGVFKKGKCSNQLKLF